MIVREVLLIEEYNFSRGRGSGSAGRKSLETGQPLVDSSVCVDASVNEEIAVHLKIRMKRQTEQPLFAAGGDLRRQVHVERFGWTGGADVGHDLDAPAFFQNKYAVRFTRWRHDAKRLRKRIRAEGVDELIADDQ